MCGICGVYNYRTNQGVDAEQLRKMTGVLRHRGPDEQGFYIKDQLGLGHQRLSIIDLATGTQPITNEDKSILIVFNGEIYNYRQLREEVKSRGHSLRTASDTEVIIHLYEDAPEEFINRLNGIFAFCIWDAKRRKLILARDRLGVKPLFYSFVKQGVIFASEVKSILQHHAASKEIDPRALDDFFSLGYITGGKSIFKSIESLKPATILTITKDHCRQKQYWDISYNHSDLKSEREYTQGLLERLDQAVKKQMVSDVPVGAFLSGGLDSSSIVNFMVDATENKVRTYSIGFLEKSYSELDYAQMASDFFATAHKQMIVKPDIEHLLAKLVWFYDEPFADTSAISTYFVAKLAAGDLKVVLSGDGGDELFLGYPTYVADKLAVHYKRLPRFARVLTAKTVNRLPSSFDKISFDYKAKMFVQGAEYPPLMAHYWWRLICTDSEKESFYSGDLTRQLQDYSPYAFFEQNFNHPQQATTTQRLSYVDFKTWLVDDILRKVDRASMANSLESRVPLLDHELVEFAAGLPDHLKLNRFKTKYLLKQAVKDRLPKRIVYRKKSGFNSPVAYWIKNELKSYVLDYLSSQRIKRLGYFRNDFVQNMLQQHFQQTKDNSLKIWSLLNFVLWHEIFIEGKSSQYEN
ncbi:asparagine synthase (glutamine-hydrolyzing) [Candidatus Omnitrophota bacterium]